MTEYKVSPGIGGKSKGNPLLFGIFHSLHLAPLTQTSQLNLSQDETENV